MEGEHNSGVDMTAATPTGAEAAHCRRGAKGGARGGAFRVARDAEPDDREDVSGAGYAVEGKGEVTFVPCQREPKKNNVPVLVTFLGNFVKER